MPTTPPNPAPSLSPPALPSWRHSAEVSLIRAASHSLYARLRSIEHDAKNLLHLHAAIAPHLPLVPNFRAGAWYAPPSLVPRAHFKSADGHYSQWSVSPRRPNIAFLRCALRAGGALVADVTRAGKAWPDALARTLPMWCAVVSALAAGVADDDVGGLLAYLHLHPSVPANERVAIERRLPAFLRIWREAGVDIGAVAPEVRRGDAPRVLRCLWVRADAERVWEDGVPSERVLGYCPVVCVSASCGMEGRDFVEAGAGEEVVGGVVFPRRDVGFAYVQGAGDDEEGWGFGLTPEVFWREREVLLEFARVRQNARISSEGDRVEMRKLLEGFEKRGEGDAGNVGVVEVAEDATMVSVLAMGRVEVVASTAGRVVRDVEVAAAIRSDSRRPVIVLSHGESKRFEARDEDLSDERGDFVRSDGAAWLEESRLRGVHWFNMADRRGKPDFKHALRHVLEPCLALIRESLTLEDASNREPLATVICDSGSGDWATAIGAAWLAWHCVVTDDGGYVVAPDPGGRVVDKTVLRRILLRIATERSDLVVSRRSIQQLNTHFYNGDKS